ncbi:hypothetical protein KR009_001431 [Drosophila setifemur]|nr:hypothetical protein KR009_001431 [Drosophila setifemur]
MSVPSSFKNAETYFDAALEFLSTYSWIYREANTACLASINLMPDEFKNYFLRISNEKLNEFPFVLESIVECPPSLLTFCQNLANLTPKDGLGSLSGSPLNINKKPVNNKGISAKKMLEIKHLAAHIYAHCAKSQLMVDLGAGLGYLNQELYGLNPKYIILGLESDKSRVETARQRCRGWLPTSASKSVSYEQLFVNESSDAYIDARALELAKENDCIKLQTMSIIGLHACADLSINAMRLFLKMPRVRCLHIMPCCYHKMELQLNAWKDSDPTLFINFPLSDTLHKSFESSVPKPVLNRPFLRLACQRTSARWVRDCTEDEHAKHGYQMYMRGVAEAVRSSEESVIPRKMAVPICTNPIDFCELKRRFQLHSNDTGGPVEWQISHEERFLDKSAKFIDNEGPRLAEALTCLQTAMQKLCENLVLLDRLCFLEEAAAKQKLRVKIRYEAIFDEKVSPRCHVLVAEKLS